MGESNNISIQCLDADDFIMCKVYNDTIYIMHKNGKAFACVSDMEDGKTIYLNSLYVDESIRNQGIGTKLQEIREQIGVNSGAKYYRLIVFIGSWMHEWYKRRGYYDLFMCEEDDDYMCMQKDL